jgi:hypothetical protein
MARLGELYDERDSNQLLVGGMAMFVVKLLGVVIGKLLAVVAGQDDERTIVELSFLEKRDKPANPEIDGTYTTRVKRRAHVQVQGVMPVE